MQKIDQAPNLNDDKENIQNVIENNTQQKTHGINLSYLQQNLQIVTKQQRQKFNIIKRQDEFCKLSCSAEAVINILENIKKNFDQIIQTQNQNFLNRLFPQICNLSNDVFRYCKYLKQTYFKKFTLEYLEYTSQLMKRNELLCSAKYIDQILKFDLEITSILESENQIQQAMEYFESVQKMIQDLRQKNTERKLDGFKEAYKNYERLVNLYLTKFQIVLKKIPKNQIQKQLEVSFDDKSSRVQVILDSIQLCQKNQHFVKGQYDDLIKELIEFLIEYIKGDTEQLCNLLQQKKEALFEPYKQEIQKIQQPEQIDQKSNNKNKQQQVKQPIDIGQIENQINEKSENFNLNQHIEFITLLFNQKDQKNFHHFYLQASQRLKNYNLERQFLQEINFLISKTPNPVPPEGYQIINVDINQAFLVDELDRVRNQQKKFTLQEQVVKESKKYTTDMGIEYTEEELLQTEHQFVYIILKKTLDASKTIIDLHLTMENEFTGPIQYLKKDYKVIQVPINQYRGVQATYQTVPFLCIKHVEIQNEIQKQEKTHDWNRGTNKSHFLQPIIYEQYLKEKNQNEKEELTQEQNEAVQQISQEEQLTEEQIQQQNQEKIQKFELQIDTLSQQIDMSNNSVNCQINRFIEHLKPILCNSFHVRSQYQYKQLPLELRQVPKEFINLENKTYLYFFYKQQTNYHYNIILLKLLKSYVDFEQSFESNKNIKQQSPVDICKVMLNFYFKDEMFQNFLNEFQNFVETLKTKEDFQKSYFDLVYFIGIDFWKKYIKPFLTQYEFYEFSIFNDTLPEKQQEFFSMFLNEKTLQLFTQALLTLIDLCDLHKLQEDIVLESNLTLFLSKILELNENYIKAYEILKMVNKKINIYRDWKASNYSEKSQEFLLPLSTTCSNLKIHQCFEGMKENLIKYKQQICSSIAQKCCKNYDKNQNKIQDELQQFENDIFFKDLLNQNDDLKSFMEKIQIQNHSEYDLLIINIQCQILYCLSRCFLMIPFKVTQTQRNSFTSMPTSFYRLLNYKNQQSQKQVLQNNQTLKNSLQEAKEIQRDKIKFQKNEKSLLKISANNKYLRAIFISSIALTKEDVQEQQSLIESSLKILHEQQKYEQKLLDLSIQNSQYLFKYSQYNENQQQKLDPLFKCLVEGITEEKTENPKSPIILKFNRKSITLCFPFYNPQISQKIAYENPEQKTATYISIRGAMVNNNNMVGENSYNLSKTGELMVPDRMVKIDELIPNKKYQFALIGYDSKKVMINKLGKLSPVIYTILPMPLQNIYSHIGKCAFLLRNYRLAIEAFTSSTQNILELKFSYKQNFKSICQNFQFYKLNRENLNYYSLPEIAVLSESTYLLAQALHLNYYERVKKSVKDYPLFKLQIKILQIVELLIVSSELAIQSKQFQIAILSVISAYNYLDLFLKHDNLPFQILNILLKIQNALSMIPGQYINDQLSIISNKIYYYLINSCFQNKQSILILKALYMDLNIQKKYFQLYPVQDDKNLNFEIYNLKNLEIQCKFFEFFQLANPKLINQMDHYEEQIQKSLQVHEDVEEKQFILQNIKDLRDFFDYIQDQKTALQNLLKRFQEEQLLNYLLKYIQIQNLKNQEIDFNLIEENFTKFTEYKQIQQIIDIKEKLIEEDIQWNNIEIYDELIDLQELKEEDTSENLKSYIKQKQLLDQYKDLISQKKQITQIYGEFNNVNTKYLSYYLFLKVQYKTKEFQQKYQISQQKNYNANIFLLYYSADKLHQKQKSDDVENENMQKYDQQQIEILEQIFQCIYHCMVFSYLSDQQEILKNCIMYSLNFIQKSNTNQRHNVSVKIRHYLLLINEISFEVYRSLNIKKMSLKSTEDNLQQNNIDYIELLQGNKIQQESLIYSDDQQYWTNLFVLNLQLNQKLENPNFILHLSKKLFDNNKQKKLVRFMQYLISICKSKNKKVEKIILNEEQVNCQIEKQIEEVKNLQIQKKQQYENESQEQSLNQESDSFAETQNLNNEQQILQQKKKVQDKYINVLKQTSNYLMNEQEQYQNMYSQMNLQIAKNDIIFAQVLEKIKNLYNNNKLCLKGDQQNQSYNKEIIYQLKNDVIEIQKKKNSYHNLVISLNTLGEFYYKLKDKDMAEENWREALDSVFQKLNVLDHLDEVFNKLPFEQDLVLKYNYRSLHITIVICYRLSEYIYYNNLEKQRQCLQLVNHVMFHLLSGALPHPLSLEDFKNYKLQQNLFPNIFQNPIILKSNELVKALNYFTQMNNLYQNYLNNLPIYCYLEYLSEFQIYSIYENFMARYGKIFSLAQTGFINEAISNYRDLCFMRHLPQFIGTQNVFSKQNQGYYVIEEYENYQNDITPYDDRNKTPLKNFADLDQSKVVQFLQTQKIELLLIFKTLKSFIYKCIYRNENLEMIQYSMQRETILRENLKQIQEVQKQLQLFDIVFSLVDFQQNMAKDNPNLQSVQNLIQSLLQQQNYITTDMNNICEYYKKYYQTLQQRHLFCQLYFFVSIQISDFYNLLNYQLDNLNHLSNLSINYQKFNQNNILNISLLQQYLKNDNQQQKQNKNQTQIDVNNIVNEIQEKFNIFINQNAPKFCINSLNCIYIKYLIIKQLYYVKNHKILERFLLNVYNECYQNKELFYLNLCKGVEARFQFDKCNIQNSITLFKQCEQYIQEKNVYNREFALILGDYAELLVSQNQIIQKSKTNKKKNKDNIYEDNIEDACQVYKKAIYILKKVTTGITVQSENTNQNIHKYIVQEIGENKNKIESIFKTNDYSAGTKQKNQKQNIDKTNKKNQDFIEPKTKQILDKQIHQFQYQFQVNTVDEKHTQHNNTKISTLIYCENQKYLMFTIIKYLQYKLKQYSYEYVNKKTIIQNIDFYLEKLKILKNQLQLVHLIYTKNYFIRNIHKGHAEFLKAKLDFLINVYSYLKIQNTNILQLEQEKGKSFPDQGLFISQRAAKHFPGLNLYLIQIFLPSLHNVKENLIHSLKYLKEEKVNIQFDFSTCDIYNLILEVNKLLYQYTQPFDFQLLNEKYMNAITQEFNIEFDDQKLNQWIQKKNKEYIDFEKRIVNENFKYVKKINEFQQAQKNLKLNFHQFEISKDFEKLCQEKLTKDVQLEIQQQKQYSALRNQTNHNILQINEIDLINYFKQLDRKTFFVFLNFNYLQQQIKIHKFLLQNPYYLKHFMVEETQIDFKANLNAEDEIEDGVFLFLTNELQNSEIIQINYMLSKQDNVSALKDTDEKLNKAVKINEAIVKQQYYQGHFQTDVNKIWKLQQQIENMYRYLTMDNDKRNMDEEIEEFYDIIISFAKMMLTQQNQNSFAKVQDNIRSFLNKNQEQFYFCEENLNILKEILNFGGTIKFNDYFLMIFRKIHKIKFKYGVTN